MGVHMKALRRTESLDPVALESLEELLRRLSMEQPGRGESTKTCPKEGVD